MKLTEKLSKLKNSDRKYTILKKLFISTSGLDQNSVPYILRPTYEAIERIF